MTIDMKITNRSSKALTIMEMVISLSIMAVVFAAVIPQFRLIQNSWDSKQGAAEAIQNMRIVADHINRKLSTAVKVIAVSDSATQNGFIEFEANDGLTYRYDVDGQGYVQYGLLGDQSQLAGPVTKLQFSCFALDDLDTSTVDVDSIRFVKCDTSVVNTVPAARAQDVTVATYINVESAEFLFESSAIGAIEVDNMADTQIATQAVLSKGGTVTSISAYIRGGVKGLRFAIYTDNGGQPGDLIVESASVAGISNKFEWQQVAVASTHLTAGTYWLALAFDVKQQVFNHSESGSGQLRYKSNDAVANGFTAQWNSSDQSRTERISIYASYIPD